MAAKAAVLGGSGIWPPAFPPTRRDCARPAGCAFHASAGLRLRHSLRPGGIVLALRAAHSLPARRGGAFKRIGRMRAGQLCCPCFFLCVFLPGSLLPGEATHKKRHRCCDALISGVLLSGKRDSNPRPSAWEADALPTELFPQKHCKCRNFLPLFKDFLFPMSDFS